MYLTEFLKKPVYDRNNKNIGKVHDIIFSSKDIYPKIEALEIKKSRNNLLLISSKNLDYVDERGLFLNKKIENINEYKKESYDIKLSKDILDRQIVDMEGKKIRRVNDIEITPKLGFYYIIGADIGTNGLFRRLGMGKFIEKIHPRNNIISWEDIDTLDYLNLKLKVTEDKLEGLHPADIADIVDNLGLTDSKTILDALDEESAADVFEEVSPEKQKTLLTGMGKKEAAELIDEMSPDDAADLLASIPDYKKEEILKLMDPKESKELRELLAYPENTAGGIMTTEFAYITGNLTTKETFKQLRQMANDVETIYYVYVESTEGKLKGVLSIRDLFLHDDEAHIYDYMNTESVYVYLHDDEEEVAKKIAKYNLIALPVLDENEKIRGIITVDDAIDIVLPTAWKKRIPKMFR